MATKGSDTAYMMLSKLSPLRAFPASTPTDPLARLVAKRWTEVSPWALMAARKALDPATSFAFYRERHSTYLRRLLIARVTLRTIRSRYLDDPTKPAARFDQIFDEALERRRATMARQDRRRPHKHPQMGRT